MEQPVIAILLALVIAGILWIARTSLQTREGMLQIRTLLLGENGTTGIIARVNSLHEWRNEMQRRELEAALEENRRLRDRAEAS